MTTPSVISSLRLLGRGAVPTPDAVAVVDGAGLGRADVLAVDVAGAGAVACVQGLLTNDVERPGDGAFVYGAVLSTKGMILSDLWALRKSGAVLLLIPSEGKAAVDDVLRRALPPRLARATERPATAVWRLVGPTALEVATRAGIAVPEPGRSSASLVSGCAVVAARPRQIAPFALELHLEAEYASAVVQTLGKAGAREIGAEGLELARLVAGWPRLNAEIDGKTLPQEVRYDEIDGVSYTKGCYTGQETVARVHFRGHPNRVLAGVAWAATPDFSSTAVLQDGREIGWVTSAAWLEPAEQHIGLVKIRRETDRRAPITVGGASARIMELPFAV
jgi:folate-binding protein YgfZ